MVLKSDIKNSHYFSWSFKVRNNLLFRHPFLLIIFFANILFSLFGTILGPIPLIEKGKPWGDFLISNMQGIGLIFCIFLTIDPSSKLLLSLPIISKLSPKILIGWLASEITSLFILLLICLIIGVSFLPRPIFAKFLAAWITTFFQISALFGITSYLRSINLRPNLSIIFILFSFTLFSLPPLSYSDPKRIIFMDQIKVPSFIASILVWSSISLFFYQLHRIKENSI